MIKKPNSLEKRLQSARAELAEAEKHNAYVAGKEDDALGTAELHAKWRSSKAAAQSEVDRLTRLVQKIEGEIEEASRREAEAEQLKLEREAEKSASETAALITDHWAQIQTLTHGMLRAIAESDLIVDRANAGIPDDRPQIASAEKRARSTPYLPKKILSERIVEHWVYDESGDVLSQETALKVRLHPDRQTGHIYAQSHSALVTKRKLREVTYLPEERGEQPLKWFFEALDMPGLRPTHPVIWSPMRYAGPQSVIEQLNELDALERETKKGDDRQPKIELLPIEEEADDALEKAS